MVPDWPPATYLAFAVAIAAVVSAWVAVRAWRPSVELFADFVTEIAGHGIYKPYIQVANLSPVGVWVEEIVAIGVNFLPVEQTRTATMAVKQVIPAFQHQRFECHGLIIEAHPGEDRSQDLRSGNFRFRVHYRVHKEWRWTTWTKHRIEFSMTSVHKAEHLK